MTRPHSVSSSVLSAVADKLTARGLWLATAESCTGGLVAAALTSIPGSSAWFKGAVVAYANEVKTHLLWVPEALVVEHGAVSEPVALAMAEGVTKVVGARAAVAVTGIAGPTGDTPDKPVGTVWIAWRTPESTAAERFVFDGDREAVRAQSVVAAIEGLRERL